MRFTTITYIDHSTGWNIRELKLGRLSLLVGASGVGKTQILDSIANLCEIAQGKSCNGIEWIVSFTVDNSNYIWRGRFEEKTKEDYGLSEKNGYNVLEEQLSKDDEIIIDRDSSRILFDGSETVKLDATKSAISLLCVEPKIYPAWKAITNQVYKLQKDNLIINVSPSLNEMHDKLSIDAIHDFHFLSPIEKLFLIKKKGLKEFDYIKEEFIEIFPQIEDVDFTTTLLYGDKFVPVLTIKEKGVDKWIINNISAGMLRTLYQLTILFLAKDGDVVLIDEFENGLGVNCIDVLAEQINVQNKEIQFVITSHHPYIINNIPFDSWRVVVRDKSDVSVLTANELNIGTHSRHDAFMQLIQTTAFKTGHR